MGRLRSRLATGTDQVVLTLVDAALRSMRRAAQECVGSDATTERRAAAIRQDMADIISRMERLGTIASRFGPAGRDDEPIQRGRVREFDPDLSKSPLPPVRTRAAIRREKARQDRVTARAAARKAVQVKEVPDAE